MGSVVGTKGNKKVTAAVAMFYDNPRNEPLRAMAEIIDFRMFIYRRSVKNVRQLVADEVEEEIIQDALKAHAPIEAAAVDILTKTIPYCRPKLTAVAVKSEVEHRYVLVAPGTVKIDDWVKQALEVEDDDVG